MPTRISSTSKHHPLHARRRAIRVPFGTQRFLAAFEGFEGGFAIGASIVVALSFTNLSLEILLATAIITIIVNGFNNSSVKYSSEHYLDELDGRERKNAFRYYFIPSLIEFVSYFAISFISIIPLMVLGDKNSAITLSVIITLAILYAAGYWRAYMLQMPRHRDAVETVVLGGGIILVGLVSGYCLHLLQIG
jgi:hypothetical protein